MSNSESESGSERKEWVVLGRVVGTATDWGGDDLTSLMLYEFQPAEGCTWPKGDICIDFKAGTVQAYDAEGKVISECDCLDGLANAQRCVAKSPQ